MPAIEKPIWDRAFRGGCFQERGSVSHEYWMKQEGDAWTIVRFYTVRRVKDARTSAFWALLFIAILYVTAPATAATRPA